MIRRPRNLLLQGLLCVGFVIQGSAIRAADSADPPETWITGIAAVSGKPAVYASTAKGLLLREAAVLKLTPGAGDDSEPEVLYEHPAGVWDIVATPDGKTVASVDYKGNLVTFDTESGEHKIHEGVFQWWCQTLVASEDSKSLVAGNEAGELKVWDLAGEKVSKTLKLGDHAISDLAWATDSGSLAATDGSGHVHLVAWPSMELVGKVAVGQDPVWCVAFSDPESCWVGSANGNLYRIDRAKFSEPAPETEQPPADDDAGETDADAKQDTKGDEAATDNEEEKLSDASEQVSEPGMMPSFEGKDWITQIVVNDDGEIAIAEIGGVVHLLREQSDGTLASSVQLDSPSGVWALRWNANQLLIGTRKHGLRVAARSWKWLDE